MPSDPSDTRLRTSRFWLAALGTRAMLALSTGAGAQPCPDPPLGWPTFDATNAESLFVFDEDGSGPIPEAMLVFGVFQRMGNVSANYIAKWDGRAWSALEGGELSSAASSYLSSDPDGPGGENPILFVGGGFTSAGGVQVNCVAQWKDQTWSALGRGVGFRGITRPRVNSLTIHDDGTGPQLYVGGRFSLAGGRSAQRIARWNGSQWSDVGGGAHAGSEINTICSHDDGNGARLYAGGDFSTMGGNPIQGLAMWNGSTWNEVGGGLQGEVFGLYSFDFDGAGPQPPLLLVRGNLTVNSNGQLINQAAWNGTAWTALPGQNFEPFSFRTIDMDGPGGNEPVLYAYGMNTATQPVSFPLCRWNGNDWEQVGNLTEYRAGHRVETFDTDGEGPLPRTLISAGLFSPIYGTRAKGMGRLTGSDWVPITDAPDFDIERMLQTDLDGPGPLDEVLVVAGRFGSAGGVTLNGIGKWDGSSWESFDAGLGDVYGLAMYDADGPGPALPSLFACGDFVNGSIQYTAKWDGVAWSGLGSSLSGGRPDSIAKAMKVFDTGGGDVLVVGGRFETIGGVQASNVAAWDGFVWSPIGNGVLFSVNDIEVYDADGPGPAKPMLVAAGEIPGVTNGARAAMFNGVFWESITANQLNGARISRLEAAHSEALGRPALYAAGDVQTIGTGESGIIQWDGQSWRGLGGGLGGAGMFARDVVRFDANGRTSLLVSGSFNLAGSIPASNIATWDGLGWNAIGLGLDGDGGESAAINLTGNPSIGDSHLAISGAFDYIDGAQITRLAFVPLCDACYPDCDASTGIGILDIFDFLCFQNAFVNADPYACDCDTSTGPGVCDIFDFLCFQNAFVAGCP